MRLHLSDRYRAISVMITKTSLDFPPNTNLINQIYNKKFVIIRLSQNLNTADCSFYYEFSF